jgi:hypothetical protein
VRPAQGQGARIGFEEARKIMARFSRPVGGPQTALAVLHRVIMSEQRSRLTSTPSLRGVDLYVSEAK